MSEHSGKQGDEASGRQTMQQFREKRDAQNHKVMDQNHLAVKRFFNLDTQAYKDGALTEDIKELLGLVSSAVLRCDDCIDYHLDQCARQGWSKDQLVDALNVALIVGGSIVIPHFRHAVETMEELEKEGTLRV